jgi:hypothetical protein
MPSNVPTYKAVEARADELRRDRKKKTKNDVVVRLASLVHQVRGPCAAQCNTLDCVQAYMLKLARTFRSYQYRLRLTFCIACCASLAATQGVVTEYGLTMRRTHSHLTGAPDCR